MPDIQSKRRIMFGLDPEVRIDALREALDVEDLLEELSVRNTSVNGNETWASCPFHDDRKRHWSINTDQDSDRWGLHSCFVCRESGQGGSGNVVTLVRDLLQLENYGLALRWLEDFAGVDTSEEAALDLTVKRRLRRTRGAIGATKGEEDPGALYARMRPLEADSLGWKYLTGRGVTPEQISVRGVRMGRDRYRGRVVFPIYSGLSIVNFYARNIGTKGNKGLYAKKKGTISTTLWGMDKANKLFDLCYLVEGIFDSLTGERLLNAAGAPEAMNIFATDGPIVHKQQARLLTPFKTIVVVPDMKGKARSIVPTAKEHLQNHRLLITEPPREMDLDDWGRDDPEAATESLLYPVSLHQTIVTTMVNYTIRR